MNQREVVVGHPAGLHARPAAHFVAAASRFASRITLLYGGRSANAKSMIAVLSLGAGPGARLTIAAEGDDAAAAVETLAGLVEAGG